MTLSEKIEANADLAPHPAKALALVWEDWSACRRANFTAITGFGRYGIMQMHFPEMHFKIEPPYGTPLSAATLEAAKAAAQADYEARILAALEPSPSLSAALALPEVRALVEALEFYADRGFDGYDAIVTDYGYSLDVGHIIEDGGDRARAALAAMKGGGE